LEKNNFIVHFIFISSGKGTEKTSALADKYNRDNQNQNVKFDVWDISRIRDEFVSVKSIEEQYPELVKFTLTDNHHLEPNGELENITFVVRGTRLKEIAIEHKDSLFNWNIRRFLGKKGEVNKGLTATIETAPKMFFYYNNGISALCDSFDFDENNKVLEVHKLQIVNGAQTLGAIKNASNEKLHDVLVLVKLTAIKHSNRERGIAADLIKTNNTQNTLRAPDFRSNDKIQQWLETKFKNTKPRGDMMQITYGRKRPYPRATASQPVLKLQDLGKIRYAWYHDPRIPIADPAKLFEMPEDNGLYGFAFGSDGDVVDVWSDEQFRDCLLAIHTYDKINSVLHKLKSENDDLKQITRLRYYGLKLFKLYFDQTSPTIPVIDLQNLYHFGAKYNDFFDRAAKIISRTLLQSYRDILKRDEGTAFSLPRDAKVWDLVRTKFEDNLALIRDLG
jgi:AIPR protein